MKIKYEFINGETTEIEVDENIGTFIVDSRRNEENLARKERYHCYSSDVAWEGEDYADPDTPESLKLSEDNVKSIIASGIENMNIVDFYVSYANEESEETMADMTSDTDFEPLRVLLENEKFNYVREAFYRLDYRERLVVSEYLAFCPDCFKLKPNKTKLSEIAIKLCLTPDAIENEYKKAIKKMRKYLTDKLV